MPKLLLALVCSLVLHSALGGGEDTSAMGDDNRIKTTPTSCGTLPSPALPHRFSICTMVRDEARYIEEWVAYHVLLHVDHIYMYNDRSTDNVEDILSPYIERGLVSLIYWDGNQTVPASYVAETPTYTANQRYALADCVFNHNHESEWFGIWDVDEFLVLDKQFSDVPSFITNYLSISNKDELHIPMTIFGTSGHTASPAGLVIGNYEWRSNITSFGIHPQTDKFTGKSLYKSNCVAAAVHWEPTTREGCLLDYEWPTFDNGEIDYPIHLNHYFTKSWADFAAKMQKWGWEAIREDFDTKDVLFSEYRDTTMRKFIEPIQEVQACIRKLKNA